VDTLFLKGKEKKEQLPSLEVEDRLESALSQPEYKQQQLFFLTHRFVSFIAPTSILICILGEIYEFEE